MYKQLKKQIDDKEIITKNIRELEDRIKFKIQKQLGLHGTSFSDIKIEAIGKKDDKFLRTFSQIENLDKDRLTLIEERDIIDKFLNDIYKSISKMGNLELNVFKSRYILGLTQQETATRLNYTIDRIKQIDRNIKEKLKDYTFITP
jgi:DNA-directed RNA polymerase specialized sigma subunit